MDLLVAELSRSITPCDILHRCEGCQVSLLSVLIYTYDAWKVIIFFLCNLDKKSHANYLFTTVI